MYNIEYSTLDCHYSILWVLCFEQIHAYEDLSSYIHDSALNLTVRKVSEWKYDVMVWMASE